MGTSASRPYRAQLISYASPKVLYVGSSSSIRTWGHTGTMMGVWKSRWRRHVCLCFPRRRLRWRMRCSMRSSDRAAGVSDACTRNSCAVPSWPTSAMRRWLDPWRRTMCTSAPKKLSLTCSSGCVSACVRYCPGSSTSSGRKVRSIGLSSSSCSTAASRSSTLFCNVTFHALRRSVRAARVSGKVSLCSGSRSRWKSALYSLTKSPCLVTVSLEKQARQTPTSSRLRMGGTSPVVAVGYL
mmetsp:Transcript_11400/g.23837  ORF Transcript_11400/g.23837 Transcript_11400/m.23837 type:complete len:240 (-) Transcript_11400:47-766(-)